MTSTTPSLGVHTNTNVSISISTNEILSNPPTCPSLWYRDSTTTTNSIANLPLLECSILCEIHLSTAFISQSVVFSNNTPHTISLTTFLLSIPHNTTVTAMKSTIGDTRTLHTEYIPTEQANTILSKGAGTSTSTTTAAINEVNPYQTYLPHLFKVPLSNILPGQQVSVHVDYIVSIPFISSDDTDIGNRYTLTLSLVGIPSNKIGIRCILNVLEPKVSFSSTSHRIELGEKNARVGRMELTALPKKGNNGDSEKQRDFMFSFWSCHEKIYPLAIQQNASPSSSDPRSSLLLLLSPSSSSSLSPSPSTTQPISRDFVFLIDRSASMDGTPFQEAIRALQTSLNTLQQSDKFTVISFDHQMEFFSDSLIDATEDNISLVERWARTFPPRGGTDISTPLDWALNFLEKKTSQSKSKGRIPIVLLITDGCVANEKEMVEKFTLRNSVVRIFTFGIGMYCNWYYLQMLAVRGKGFAEMAVYPDHIFPRMVGLLERTRLPLLTDVRLLVKDDLELEMYPNPIPDLYAGNPLIISTKYEGELTDTLTVLGINSYGKEESWDIEPTFTETVPLDRVFLKQRVDMLTADYWLNGGEEVKQRVVDISCDENVPCPWTTLVAYEEVEEKNGEQQQEQEEEKGEFGDEKKNTQKKSTKHATAMALAGGAVVSLGVASFMFGDLAATQANLSYGDMFGSSDATCCDTCGEICDTCGEVCADF